MLVELDVLTETYLIMKEYVPSKDRQSAADQLLANLVDMGIPDPEFEKFCATDSYLKNAAKDYLDDEIGAGEENDDLDFED